jgi:site-specific DNA recombinase
VGEQIVVSVPAIVDRDLWERAQARRTYNRRMSKRNGKREYLLRGLVRCGCGGAMVGAVNNRKYTYFRCARQCQRFAGLEDKGCHEKPVRTDTLDALTWNYVKSVMIESRL